MDDGFTLSLLTLQYCFDWIVATIVAVQWCYIFRLSLPQYAELPWVWALYSLFLMLVWPCFKLSVVRNVPQRNHTFLKRHLTIDGGRILLSMTSGQAVGTGWSVLVSLILPRPLPPQPPPRGIVGHGSFTVASPLLPEPSRLGTHAEIYFLLAIVSALVTFIAGHTIIEWLFVYNVCSEETFLGVVLSLILNSLWSTLGYFSNSFINQYLAAMPEDFPSAPHGPSSIVPPHSFIPPQDAGNGSPPFVPPLHVLLGKVVLLSSLGAILITILPEPPPTQRGRLLYRRVLVTTQMVLLMAVAFAATDFGYYLGTKFAAERLGNEIGLFVSFIYAAVISTIVVLVGRRVRFKPRQKVLAWMFEAATWHVSYAWWYPWQQMLSTIQGFGLTSWNEKELLKGLICVAISCTFAIVLTFFSAFAFGWHIRRRYAARVLGNPAWEQDVERLLAEPPQGEMYSCLRQYELRFLAQCSGMSFGGFARNTNGQPRPESAILQIEPRPSIAALTTPTSTIFHSFFSQTQEQDGM